MKKTNLSDLILLSNKLNNLKNQDFENSKENFNKLKEEFESISFDTTEQRSNVKKLESQYKELKEDLIEIQKLLTELDLKIKNETNFSNITLLNETKNEIKKNYNNLKNQVSEQKAIIDLRKNKIKEQKYILHVFYFGVMGYAHFLNKNNLDFQEVLQNINHKFSPYFYHQAVYLLYHHYLEIPFNYNDYHYKCRGKIARIVVSLSNSSLSLEIEKNILETQEYNTDCLVDYKNILTLIKIQNLSLALLAYIEIDFHSTHERKVAHYTNLHVGNKLLTGTSPIRLNSTNFMNDPLEGLALNNFINIQSDNDLNPHNHTFLTCFTFNHNSLNQFRLYGNIMNIECSGLSIVYDENFFSSSKSSYKHDNEINKDFKSNKLPLFRCIYIDPISGFIKIAQRSDYSFFQEHIDFRTAKENMEAYKQKISKIEEYSQEILFEIKSNINTIHKESLIISKNINLVLKNIKFLFKHFSFQEEQECRIIRTEKIESNNVIYDKITQRSFIEYNSLDEKYHIKNVYIGKASSLYLTHIIKNISFSSKLMPKVKVSENPYNVLKMVKDINLD